MVLDQVLTSAFLGCGKRLSDVRRARKWRQADAHHRRHYQDPASPIGALARVGPIIAGQLLSTMPFEEAIQTAKSMSAHWQYRPGFLADLTSLGDSLIRSAKTCLPNPFLSPPHFLYREVLGLPETLKNLAKRWRRAGLNEKRTICDLLSCAFKQSDYPSKDGLEDRLNQPAIRVLPHLYGPWRYGEHAANCLGKAMLVAAFARVLKTPALAVTPIKTIGALYAEQYAAILNIALTEYPDRPVPLTSEHVEDLRRSRENALEQLEERSWNHLAIVIRAEPGKWIYVDPNMGVTSYCPEHWDLESVHSRLSLLRPALPTVSLLLEDGQIQGALDAQLETAKRCCTELPDLLEPVANTATNEEVVEALVRSRLLDKVLRWKYFELDLPKSAPRRLAALCALHECCLAKEERIKGGDPSPKVLWFCFLKKPESWFLEQFEPGEAYSALVRMCFRFATRTSQEMLSELDRINYSDTCVHPQNQVSLVGPGLAVPALAHVALAEGLGTAEEVEPQLNAHSFDLHRLLYSAGGLLRKSAVDTRHAYLSASVLKNLPFRPASADRVLRVFQR